jgi:hypothetical protein
MTDSTANTMVVQMHYRSGMQVATLLNGQTGDVTMTIQDPNYQRIIAIPDDLVKPYVDLFLHKMDLQRALAFLVAFDKQGVKQPSPTPTVSHESAMPVVAEALWLAALAATMKCFQSSAAREMLSAETVFGIDTPLRAAYDVLRMVRNRHVLHDENDWTQAVPYALLADAGNDEPDLGDINCVVLEGTDYAHIAQLRSVVFYACNWIGLEIERHTEVIRAELQGRTYSELEALPPPLTTDLPTPGSIAKKRGK